ncbi:MAG: Shikimate kinase [Planctomycetota bacterium]
MPWLDLDQRIELAIGEPIKDFFASRGEESFRDVESRVLEECSVLPSHVLSLGGGAVLREENRRVLAHSGWTVWLHCSTEVLAMRLQKDQTTGRPRPSLTGGDVVSEIEQVMRVREPIYRVAADWDIDVGMLGPVDIAERIAQWYRSKCAL